MQHLIKEYLDNEYNIEVTHLTELNSSSSSGSYANYSVKYTDRHGFEQCDNIEINIWNVLSFINNKLNNILK
jgi:hypothetical protein